MSSGLITIVKMECGNIKLIVRNDNEEEMTSAILTPIQAEKLIEGLEKAVYEDDYESEEIGAVH